MSEKKKIRFKKMSGAGNDFILIDNLAGNYTIDWPQIVPKICDRRNGIGADGLLIIGKSAKADFTMLYYNSDGSSGGMCGNGGRCAASFFSNLSAKQEISFGALDYIYHAKILNNTDVSLRMKEPNHLELNKLIDIDEATLVFHSLDTGSPHVVIFMNDLPDQMQSEIKTSGIKRLGKAIRFHSQFHPKGTNVNFVDIISNDMISMRTYERGVECETYACGTGAIACSIISHVIRKIEHPLKVRTFSNEILSVDFKESEGRFTDVTLTGPAIITFEGEILI